MTGRLTFAALALLLSCSGVARADDHSIPLRSFDRFEFDSETADGLWAELLSSYAETESDAEITTVAARLALGGENGELGLVLPWIDVDAGDAEADGIGDLELYGKWIGRTDVLSGGIGLAMTFPTGDEDEGLSTDEYGFVPFGTLGANLGAADVRGHVGYQEFTGDDDDAADSWIYGVGLFGPLGESLALRAELLGQAFDVSGSNPDSLVFEPGVDMRLPLAESDLLFRLNGVVGLNDDDVTPDWGVGGSIVLAWRTS